MRNSGYDYTISVEDIQASISESLIQHLLPGDSTLELNTDVRMLTVLSTRSPRILAQQQFTRNEWALLMLLLKCYPYYAPYEMLLASLTSLSHSECHKRLEESRQLGAQAVKRELKPVYRALSGIRAKLDKFGLPLKISLVRDAGYVLLGTESWKSVPTLDQVMGYIYWPWQMSEKPHSKAPGGFRKR